MARDPLPARDDGRGEVDAFLRKVAATPAPAPGKAEAGGGGAGAGRLIFAMDATASREPTWDRACGLQGRMFEETAALGGLRLQLCYYRGYRECRASRWYDNAGDVVRAMSAVRCAGGLTQIRRVLEHALREAKRGPVSALVFVGDCMEENIDELCDGAARLGLAGVPVFAFHEGDDPVAARAFREVARLSGGACCRFDAGSASELRELLSAVAVYAAGGRRALEHYGERTGGVVRQLTHQVARKD